VSSSTGESNHTIIKPSSALLARTERSLMNRNDDDDDDDE